MATKKKTSSSAPIVHRSFKRTRRDEPFFMFRINSQTVYWLILSLLILGLGIWAITLSVKVQKIYDLVQAQNSTYFHYNSDKKQ